MNREQLLAISRERNVRAFLDTLAACEGTAGYYGYQTLFGGSRFESMAKHPNVAVTATMKGEPITSTAAGRYQFLHRTWKALAEQYGFPSFEAQWQDAGAVALIVEKNALADVRAGNLPGAVAKLSGVWSSLPGSPHGQPTKHASFVRDTFLRAGGVLDQPVPHAEEKPVSPFVIPALSVLAKLIPTLSELFKGEEPSRVAERNIDAVAAIAERVLPMAVEVSSTANAQAAVEAIQADPRLAAELDAAVRREYYDMQRMVIGEAREFAMSYAQMRDVRTVFLRFTFLEFFTLVIVSMSAALLAYLLWLGLLTGELLGMVVSLVLVAGFVDPRKFWLGLPAADPPKDRRE